MRHIALFALAAAAGTAGAQQFAVTEIYAGVSGSDGTADWFEITNTGMGTLDTGSLFWDDDGPNMADGGQLDSFLLGAGESAVFLIANDDSDNISDEDTFASVTAEFAAIWGAVANVGITNGGGNLSQNGDSVNISTDGGATFGFSLVFDDSFANSGTTIDNVSGFALSALGVNGAFESAAFINDSIGDFNDQLTLIGSPGVIPAPGSAALLALGAFAARRRR